MYVFIGAEGKLLSSEIGPVDVRRGQILPCFRIAYIELLEIVILEQDDIRQVAVIAGLACKGNRVLNVGGSGLGDDVQLEIRVHVLLIVLLRRFQSRDIEIGIPCVYGQSILVFGRDVCAFRLCKCRHRSQQGSCHDSRGQNCKKFSLHLIYLRVYTSLRQPV